MFPTRKAGYVLALLFTLLFGTLLSATAQTATVSLIHAFDGSSEGASPGSLMLASDGNFYGTASVGGDQSGASGHGTIFRMTPAGKVTTLYIFGADANGGYPDGFSPVGPLVEGANGSLYGVTADGGPSYNGTVFKINKSGILTTLYDFGPAFDYSHGAHPGAGLVKGADGNFYGTTKQGGSNPGSSGNGDGTVFQITPDGAHTKLHDFTDSEADGPGALTLGDDGALYGTASQNTNSQNFGSVFRVDPVAAAKDRMTGFTELKVFYNRSPNNDGYNPSGALVKDKNGDFYGTAADGNNHGGIVFKITSTGTFADLAHIPEVPSGLALGRDGNLYGSTKDQSGSSGGTLFSVTASGVVQTLFTFPMYSYSDPSVGAIGSFPVGALVTGPDGNFYGLASQGGVNYAGTVFKAYVGLGTPPHPPVISTLGYAIASASSTLTVNGSAFDPAATVTVDDQAQAVTFVSAGQLSCVLSPSLPPGTHTITVTNAGGETASKTLRLTPIVESATAVTEGGKTNLVVTGVNFPLNTPIVMVDGQTLFAEAASTPTQLYVRLGADFAAGPHTVTALGPPDSTSGASSARPTRRFTPLAQGASAASSTRTFSVYPYWPAHYHVQLPHHYHLVLLDLRVDVKPAPNAAPTQTLVGHDDNLAKTKKALAELIGNVTLSGIISNDGGSIISNDGGSLISNDGASIISNDGGSIISNDGGSIIKHDGVPIISNDGGSIISNDGGSIISNDGGSIRSTSVAGVLASLVNSEYGSLRLFSAPSGAAPSVRAATHAGPQALAPDPPDSFDLLKHLAPGGSGSTDISVSTPDARGSLVTALVLRSTPGQPDGIVYQNPEVTLTPKDDTPNPVPLNFDVTGQVTVTRSPLIRDPQSHLLSQTLTLTNPGAQTVIGPLQALLTGLPNGVTLTNAGGQVGTLPYVMATGGSLDAGQTVRVRVTFSNPANARFGYAVKVYSGAF